MRINTLDGTNACRSKWVKWDNILKCECCGSIKVESAIEYLQQKGTKYSGSDWKYGWPHKFYISPNNPEANMIVEIGREYSVKAGDPGVVQDGFGWYKPILGTREHLHCKFYTSHIMDANDEMFDTFNELSDRYFGISWRKDNKGLRYVAPTHNHQQWGVT